MKLVNAILEFLLGDDADYPFDEPVPMSATLAEEKSEKIVALADYSPFKNIA